MFSFLKKHPFAVKAFFDSSLVLTFAVPKYSLQQLIPECLTLDTLNDEYGFIAIALVQTRELRPAIFPKVLGNSFVLIGYRIFVRYTNRAGKNLRGLYIIKSETDKRKMEILGNIFTKYSYTTTDILIQENNQITEIKSMKSDFSMQLNLELPNASLPPTSPFEDWKQARRYAGPLPFTFSYDPKSREVLIVEGVRQFWVPKPVKVISQHFSFLDSLNLESYSLANAFVIYNIPYSWKRGRVEIWNP